MYQYLGFENHCLYVIVLVAGFEFRNKLDSRRVNMTSSDSRSVESSGSFSAGDALLGLSTLPSRLLKTQHSPFAWLTPELPAVYHIL